MDGREVFQCCTFLESVRRLLIRIKKIGFHLSCISATEGRIVIGAIKTFLALVLFVSAVGTISNH